jgi:hypothetical protein
MDDVDASDLDPEAYSELDTEPASFIRFPKPLRDSRAAPRIEAPEKSAAELMVQNYIQSLIDNGQETVDIS